MGKVSWLPILPRIGMYAWFGNCFLSMEDILIVQCAALSLQCSSSAEVVLSVEESCITQTLSLNVLTGVMRVFGGVLQNERKMLKVYIFTFGYQLMG